ncbi:MAG: thiamine transport system ATP-binding protein [Glaciecola sp.]|jgi:thiamine transport system ATP-binding protein
MTDRLLLENLTVGWDGAPVLAGVDLEVPAGTTMALLGPSGSGKSTLLRTVAGLLPSLGGTICVGERDVTHVPAHRRGVGMVFQAHALFPHANVGDNVGFGPRVQGLRGAELTALVTRWLDTVGLPGMAARDVNTLSGGQRQRVALARTLATEPSVVLLDEPLGALDQGLRGTVLADLRGLFEQLGTTVVHVTHDPSEAAALATAIAVLDARGVAQCGTPLDLHERPVSAEVARLLGHPNVVTAEALRLTRSPQGPYAVIPPDAVQIVDFGDPTAIPASVTSVVPGASWLTTLTLDQGASMTVPTPPRTAPAPGARVGLRLDMAAIWWVPEHRVVASG